GPPTRVKSRWEWHPSQSQSCSKIALPRAMLSGVINTLASFAGACAGLRRDRYDNPAAGTATTTIATIQAICFHNARRVSYRDAHPSVVPLITFRQAGGASEPIIGT